MQPLSPHQRELLRQGIQLFNRGRFFDCHEVLEEAWLAASGEQKKFLQGLIQTAVALHHLRQNNLLGARRLLAAGMGKLSEFVPQRETVDIEGLLAALQPLREKIAAGEASPDAAAPQIVLEQKPKVLWVSSPRIEYGDVPEWVEKAVRERFPEIHLVVGRDPETIHREIEDAEIFISWTLKPEQFARCRKLKWIHAPSTGVAHLWVPGLAESGVQITNARTVHAVPVAEHAIALMMALTRRLRDSFEYQREARWAHSESWLSGRLAGEVNGKTLVLLGLGAIGREIATRAKALGMRVWAIKRNPAEKAEGTEGTEGTESSEFAERVESPDRLPLLFAEADYVIVAMPETAETRHSIGEAQLRCLKPNSFFINISRGSLVDTEALTRRLESGALAGAALDVTDPEPLQPEHRLWRLPNVLITPHLAGATDRYWQRQSDLVQENLRRYLAGEPLLNPVDKKKGY